MKSIKIVLVSLILYAGNLYANEWTDGSCYLDAYYVRSTTTITE